MLHFIYQISGPRDVQLFQHYFRVCLWRCFRKRLAFELVNWIKWLALPKMNGHIIQYNEGLDKAKRLKKADSLSYWSSQNVLFSCPQGSWSSCLQAKTRVSTTGFLALSPSNYTTGFLVCGSPVCRLRLWNFWTLTNTRLKRK